jgi:hypothetical protein
MKGWDHHLYIFKTKKLFTIELCDAAHFYFHNNMNITSSAEAVLVQVVGLLGLRLPPIAWHGREGVEEPEAGEARLLTIL